MVLHGIIQQAANSSGGITYIGSNGVTGVASANLLSSGANALAGDVVVVYYSGSYFVPYTVPTGYTLLIDTDNSPVTCGIAYKVLTSSESTIDGLISSNFGSHVITVFRGVDNTTPFDMSIATRTNSSNMPFPPSNTVVNDGSMFLISGHSNSFTASSTEAPSGYTLSKAQESGSLGTTTMVAYKEVDAGLESSGIFIGDGDGKGIGTSIALRKA